MIFALPSQQSYAMNFNTNKYQTIGCLIGIGTIAGFLCYSYMKSTIKSMYPNITDLLGLHALCKCNKSSLEDIKQFLVGKNISSCIHISNYKGRTALFYACIYNRLDIAKHLIEKCGAMVNIRDNFDRTPLAYACRSGNIIFVRYLVEECNATVEVKDETGRNLLFDACDGMSIDVVKYIKEKFNIAPSLKDNSGNNAVFHAWTNNGSNEIVRYLMKESGDTRDNDGKTLLFYAADGNNKNGDMTTYLIEECGIDVNAQDHAGNVALSIACRSNNIPLMKELMVHGASLDIKNKIRWTPYEYINFFNSDGFNNIRKKLRSDPLLETLWCLNSEFISVLPADVLNVIKNFCIRIKMNSPESSIWRPVCVMANELANEKKSNNQDFDLARIVCTWSKEKKTKISQSLQIHGK